jgi:hypothetical protein
MAVENCVVTRQPSDQFGVHFPNLAHIAEVLSDILESLFHDTRIGEGNHSILERGHINISTSKRLICPPTGIIEGRVR